MVKYPVSQIFWGCVLYMGHVKLVPVEGMMNSKKYKSMLAQLLGTHWIGLETHQTAKTQMIEGVIQLWFHNGKIRGNCQNLINSIPRRVQEVIKAKRKTYFLLNGTKNNVFF